MNWLVGYTGINQESIARRGLKDKYLECYCPMGSKTVRHARKTEIRTFPVYSRYLFINIIPDPESLAAVRDTYGIIDILCNNWVPMEVPGWIIDDIKRRELDGAFDQKDPVKLKSDLIFGECINLRCPYGSSCLFKK